MEKSQWRLMSTALSIVPSTSSGLEGTQEEVWDKFVQIGYDTHDPHIMAFKAKDVPLWPVTDDVWFENLNQVRKLVQGQVPWKSFPLKIRDWVKFNSFTLQTREKKRKPTALEIRRLDEREKHSPNMAYGISAKKLRRHISNTDSIGPSRISRRM